MSEETPNEEAERSPRGVAVVTGASSGIGAASARHLAAAGFEVVVGARRMDRLEEVAGPIGATAIPLDVTDLTSIEAFCDQVPACSLLVNNAGGARRLDLIEEANDESWIWMYETNVLGVMRMTRALLPKLLDSGDGHVMAIGSIAAHQAYTGGAGYNAAKFGERALIEALRQELFGRPVRVTEIDPGMVETEFSLTRFEGDADRAARVYEDVEALTADDIAECVTFAATRPSHVNIDRMLVLPRDQAGVGRVHRHRE